MSDFDFTGGSPSTSFVLEGRLDLFLNNKVCDPDSPPSRLRVFNLDSLKWV